MALNAGELEILITANTKEIDQLKTKLQSVEKSASNTGASFLKMGAIIGTVSLAAVGVGNAFQMIVGKASQMENLNAEFKVMLGSSVKASELIAKIKQMAAATPFETADLVANTKTLLQFGVAQKDVMGTLQMLGDVAGNSKERLASLSLVFGQIASAGKLQGQDLLQLINVGFNPLKEIADRTGESMESLRTKMEKGQISFDMVKESFKAVTSEGGLFFKNMETQSKTFSGLVSTMQDEINNVATTIGSAFLPMLKDMVVDFTSGAQAIGQFVTSTKGIELIAQIAGNVAGTFEVLKIIFNELGSTIKEGILSIIDNLSKKFNKLFVEGDKGKESFTAIAAVVSTLNIGFSIFARVINLVISNVANLVKILQEDWTLISKVADAITHPFDVKKWQDVGKEVDKLKNAYVTLFEDAANQVADIWTSTIDLVKKLPDETQKIANQMETQATKSAARMAAVVRNALKGQGTTTQTETAGTSATPTNNDYHPGGKTELPSILDNMLGSGNNEKLKITIPINFDIPSFKSQISTVAETLASFQDTAFSGFKNIWNSIIEGGDTVKAVTESIGSTIASAMQVAGAAVQSYYENQQALLENQHSLEIQAIDERMAKELEFIENDGMSKKQKLENDLAEAQKSKDAEKIAEAKKQLDIYNTTEKFNNEKKESDKRYQQKKYKLELDAFNAKKGMDIAMVWVNAAQGVATTWANAFWPFPMTFAGIALAGVMTGLILTMAGVQTGLIASQAAPPPPAFTQGGIVPGDRRAGDAVLSRLNSGEMVLNEDQQANLFDQLTNGVSGNTSIKVFIGDRELKDIVYEINKENRRGDKSR